MKRRIVSSVITHTFHSMLRTTASTNKTTYYVYVYVYYTHFIMYNNNNSLLPPAHSKLCAHACIPVSSRHGLTSWRHGTAVKQKSMITVRRVCHSRAEWGEQA